MTWIAENTSILHRIFCIFLVRNRPKLVHQFTKTLQLLGDFVPQVPQTPYRGFAPGPHWGTSVPQTPYLLPPPNPNTLATPLYYCNSTAKKNLRSQKNSKIVSTNKCVIDRQPEIATWLPKTEIVILLELQLTASKFQRQVKLVSYFWTRRVRIKCPQMIMTMADNRKWYYGRWNRKYLYLLNHDR